jgi:acyl-coenzyme A synthetase/AMP-(fatty) acid ligase
MNSRRAPGGAVPSRVATASPSTIPLLGHRDDVVMAWRGAEPVRVSRFLSELALVAEALPERRYLVNLCRDRYRFAVGLAAALVRGQVSLLPPAHTPELLRTLKDGYEGLYALADSPTDSDVLRVVDYPALRPGGRPMEPPAFAASSTAAIAFTSGSTGAPTPHAKTWGGLAAGAIGQAQRLELTSGDPVTLVGTVPAQHMYGLESTVLLALRNGLALHAGRPFYPADVRAAVEQTPEQRVLVTTPVHLRALLADHTRLPRLRLILSATAPLAADIAAEAEDLYSAPLHEVYGFTEAGMVATRRTTQGPHWRALPGVRLWHDQRGVRVGGGHVPAEVGATDVIELIEADTFLLHGRTADLVNIAGKRSSLAYLNQQLAAVEGVEDGVFFLPDGPDDGITRLTAFVVAPGLTREALLSALRARIDPAFLPRPVHFVAALPRNVTGKLPRDALAALARDVGEEAPRA